MAPIPAYRLITSLTPFAQTTENSQYIIAEYEPDVIKNSPTVRRLHRSRACIRPRNSHRMMLLSTDSAIFRRTVRCSLLPPRSV